MKRTQELLAQVRLTGNGRREAEYYLVQGERLADAILETAASVSSMLRSLERAARAFAGHKSTG